MYVVLKCAGREKKLKKKKEFIKGNKLVHTLHQFISG